MLLRCGAAYASQKQTENVMELILLIICGGWPIVLMLMNISGTDSTRSKKEFKKMQSDSLKLTKRD